MSLGTFARPGALIEQRKILFPDTATVADADRH
jgi:hypothetical protein